MNRSLLRRPAVLAACVTAAGVLPLVLLPWLYPGATATGAAACPFRVTGGPEQIAVIVTAFVMKPAYMLLALGLIIGLWRQRAEDLAALRWGLILFLAGEVACAVNYVAFGGNSNLLEYLHDYGMVAGFAFVAWAVFEGLDQRVVKYTAPKARCAALSLCTDCVKYHPDVKCGLPRVFGVVILALLAVSLLPLCVPLQPIAYETTITGTTVTYAATLATQWFVLRYCPVLAALLLAAAWLVLRFGGERRVSGAKYLLGAALGPLGFALMRLFLLGSFRDDLAWYTSWEEFTELLFVGGVGFVLLVFRASLLRPNPSTPEPCMPAVQR